MTELLVASPEFLFDIAAGSVGGFMSKALDYPFDTAKVLLQTQRTNSPSTSATTPHYTGTFDCLQQSVKQKGFFSLYQGITSRLMGSMAENAVCFLAYAGIKRELLSQKQHQSNDKTVQLSYWDFSLAGAGAGAVVSFVMTPVELIKCRMQVSSQLPTPLYASSWDCLIQTVRQSGLTGLFQGHLSTMYREVPGNFCWYLTYEMCCDAIHVSSFSDGETTRDNLPVQAHMAAGAAAGVMYWAAIFPVDTVKSVLQTSSVVVVESASAPTSGGNELSPATARPLSFAQALKSIYKQQGIQGLYRGFGVTALRAAPANAVLFASYEQTVQFLKSM